MSLFKDHTQTEYAQAISNYLPDGRIWVNKNKSASNIRLTLMAFALEFQRLELKMNEIIDEFDINTTTQLISEWETAVGLPDDCIAIASSLENRRNNVLLKIASDGASTEQDFIDLGALLGFTITIKSGIEDITFPFTFPFMLFDSASDARFTLVVGVDVTEEPNVFPYTFPFTFTESTVAALECIFNKIKPANVNVVFQYVV